MERASTQPSGGRDDDHQAVRKHRPATNPDKMLRFPSTDRTPCKAPEPKRFPDTSPLKALLVSCQRMSHTVLAGHHRMSHTALAARCPGLREKPRQARASSTAQHEPHHAPHG